MWPAQLVGADPVPHSNAQIAPESRRETRVRRPDLTPGLIDGNGWQRVADSADSKCTTVGLGTSNFGLPQSRRCWLWQRRSIAIVGSSSSGACHHLHPFIVVGSGRSSNFAARADAPPHCHCCRGQRSLSNPAQATQARAQMVTEATGGQQRKRTRLRCRPCLCVRAGPVAPAPPYRM